MKIELKKTKQLAALTDDSTRYTLANAVVTPLGSYSATRAAITVTNGKAMGVLAVDTDGEPDAVYAWAGAFVPRQLPAACTLELGDDAVKATTPAKGNKLATSMDLRAGQGRFPAAPDVLPDVTGRRVIRLDAKLLCQLAELLSDDKHCPGVALLVDMDEPNKSIGVLPLGGDGLGVIMPMDGDDDGRAVDRWRELAAQYTDGFHRDAVANATMGGNPVPFGRELQGMLSAE